MSVWVMGAAPRGEVVGLGFVGVWGLGFGVWRLGFGSLELVVSSLGPVQVQHWLGLAEITHKNKTKT